MKTTAAFLLLMAAAGPLFAAQLYGTVYDDRFEPASRVRLTINSTPLQTQISANGSYSFFIAAGDYILTASRNNETINETVTVPTEGQYRIDLIFLPETPDDLSELDAILEPDDVATLEPRPAEASAFPEWSWIPIIAAILLAAVWLGWHHVHKKKTLGASAPRQTADASSPTLNSSAESNGESRSTEITEIALTPSSQRPTAILTPDQHKVLAALESMNGRAAQKELRKVLSHWSEAKVSLELTELEDLGVIRKIRKGRGNIIRKA